jgi:hypothetical protein
MRPTSVLKLGSARTGRMSDVGMTRRRVEVTGHAQDTLDAHSYPLTLTSHRPLNHQTGTTENLISLPPRIGAKQGRRRGEGTAQEEHVGMPAFWGARRVPMDSWRGSGRRWRWWRWPDSRIRSTSNVLPQPNYLPIPPLCTSVRDTHPERPHPTHHLSARPSKPSVRHRGVEHNALPLLPSAVRPIFGGRECRQTTANRARRFVGE